MVDRFTQQYEESSRSLEEKERARRKAEERIKGLFSRFKTKKNSGDGLHKSAFVEQELEETERSSSSFDSMSMYLTKDMKSAQLEDEVSNLKALLNLKDSSIESLANALESSNKQLALEQSKNMELQLNEVVLETKIEELNSFIINLKQSNGLLMNQLEQNNSATNALQDEEKHDEFVVPSDLSEDKRHVTKSSRTSFVNMFSRSKAGTSEMLTDSVPKGEGIFKNENTQSFKTFGGQTDLSSTQNMYLQPVIDSKSSRGMSLRWGLFSNPVSQKNVNSSF